MGKEPFCIDCQRDIQDSERSSYYYAVCVPCGEIRGRGERTECLDGSCVQPLMANSKSYCWRHWLYQQAYRNLGKGNKENIEFLEKLWEKQKGLCYYTGRKLIPGINASVDHSTSRVKNGKKSKDNVRWVDYSINNFKHAMTEEEFLNTVSEIYHKFFR